MISSTMYKCVLVLLGTVWLLSQLTLQLQQPVRDYGESLRVKSDHANTTVLVHMHIPKAAGTAISDILVTDCSCKKNDNGVNVHCVACKTVQAKDKSGRTNQYPYSVSRLTGWPCGVHPPLAVFQNCLGDKPSARYNLPKHGFFPVYLVVVREPFDRFVSETFYFHKFSAPDWKARFDYPPEPKSKQEQQQLLLAYANIPANYILHNRQVKMIGGEYRKFIMETFTDSKRLGSRWKPMSQNNSFDQSLLNDALEAVTNNPHVLLGLAESIPETVCVLEVLYGENYDFDYKTNVIYHGGSETVLQANEEHDSWRDTDVYTTWEAKNREDIEFYERAKVLFEEIFRKALQMLKQKHWRHKKISNVAPHCSTFL